MSKTGDINIPPVPKYLPEPQFSENALVVLRARYLIKGDDGQPVETPAEMLWRVAYVVALQEQNYPDSPWHERVQDLAEQFYRLMAWRVFLPNSPTLMNAGRPLGQLAACFVLPIEDSMEGIFGSISDAALIHKSGGGTGFSFSRLREERSRVGSTGGVASGPLSFLKIFDTATEQIKQGGTRRGANMGVLRVDHPDIRRWIEAKEQEGDISNFNLSVGITDNFMRAVKELDSFPLASPHTGKEVERVDAADLFQRICELAHKNGEPGVLFLDTINKANPTPELGDIEATNPCGEEPLLPYEACNLGSINLAALEEVTRVEGLHKNAIVYLCIRFLDNVIDASKYPLPKIKEAVQRTRKIGLGVMGWADYLFMNKEPYDSLTALETGRDVMSWLRRCSKKASYELAKERGPYPANTDNNANVQRNANVTTIAPTGSLSMIADCSSGIEPLFALAQTKTCLDGSRFSMVNPYFVSDPELNECESGLLDYVYEHGRLPDWAPHNLRDIYKTAQEIPPEAHLNMQAAFQKYTDAAVSKTINLPSSATVEDVARIYRLAWEQDCKGLTVYRDGSRQEQVYTSGTKQGSSRQAVQDSGQAGKKPRPDKLPGHTYRVQTGLGKLYLTVNELDGKPFEVFATIGQSGKSQTAKAEAVGRLVSLCLRSDVPMQEIVGQLEGIGGDYPTFANGRLHKSIPDAVGWILRTMYLEGSSSQVPDIKGAACPECGAELVFQEGCFLCSSCGYTKCG